MNKIYLGILFVLLSIINFSCVYDFKPDSIKGYENNLVVYGQVTNEDAPVKVYLSRTSDLYSSSTKYENNAYVAIEDENQNITQLFEVRSGEYETLENYKGIVGESYKIIIETSEQKYESEMVTLTEPVEIKDVSYDIVEIATTDIDAKVYACEFYVDIDKGNTKQNYFRYEMDEAWEIRMPSFSSIAFWNGDSFVGTDLEQVCWKTANFTGFEILNLINYGADKVNKLPVAQVTDAGKLLVKYAFNVKQYSLSDESYLFWKIQKDNINSDVLFSKNPYQATGNIKCITNPDENVLGVFEASGVYSKRIYVKGLPISASQGFSQCEPGDEPTVYDLTYGYYAVQEIPFGPYLPIADYCVDCRLTGGSFTKPDFWED